MAKIKYKTPQQIAEAVESGELVKQTVYNMIQYYKNKNPEMSGMYKEALTLIKEK